MNAPKNRRAAELGAIHAGRRALRWDDDTYRATLIQLTGKDSAANLDERERAAVLDRMRELGFKRTGKASGWTGTERGRTQQGKVRELWAALREAGALRDDSDVALRAFCARQTGRDRLEWCTPVELNKVVEGLKAWLARVRVAARSGGRG